MFKRIRISLLTVIILAAVFVGIVNAQDVTDLERVVVTATTSDNVIVSIPVDYMEIARYQRQFDSISDTDYVTDMSRAQVCQMLKQHPPQNCTMSNYPASPGIPSAAGATWAGNGCGAGPRSTFFASAILEQSAQGIYSGDLNKPVKNNPSIDFTAICSEHDRGYTSAAPKAITDSRFGDQLTALCSVAPSDGGYCTSFGNIYVYAVKYGGGGAYDQDQKQLTCSAWGDSMKKSGCA